MAGICLVPPEGHERALEAITTSGELKSVPRFQPIIEALSNMENDTLTVSEKDRKPNLYLFIAKFNRSALTPTTHAILVRNLFIGGVRSIDQHHRPHSG